MAKMVRIAFPNGGKIPVGLIGNAKEVEVDAHEPIAVPLDYATHLVDDRFAYLADDKNRKPQPVKPQKPSTEELRAEIDVARQAVEAASDDDLAAARERLGKAEAALAEAQS